MAVKPEEIDKDKYVCLSTEGLTVEIVHLVRAAIDMWTDDDMVRMNKETRAIEITESMSKRILEVNMIAIEVLKLMAEKGKEGDLNHFD